MCASNRCLVQFVLGVCSWVACVCWATIHNPVAAQAVRVDAIAPRGLTPGITTRIEVRGEHLESLWGLTIPLPGATAERLADSSGAVSQWDISLPDELGADVVPIWLRTPTAIIGPYLLAVDRLPQFRVAATDSTQFVATRSLVAAQSISGPLSVPAAISGRLSDSRPVRFHFVAPSEFWLDVEVLAQRIGSSLRPSVRVLASNRRLLGLASPHRQHGNDTRCRFRVPEDGRFTVEVRDLTYQAGDQQFFRVMVGELAPPAVSSALAVPASASHQTVFLRPVSGAHDSLLVAGAGWGKVVPLLPIPPELPGRTRVIQRPSSQPWPVGPAPRVALSASHEFAESEFAVGAPNGGPELTAKSLPWAVQGVLATPNEVDGFSVPVPASRKLAIRVEADRLGSPLDPFVTVTDTSGERDLGRIDDGPGSLDPLGEIAVPEGLDVVRVQVADMLGRGGVNQAYRLVVEDGASMLPAVTISTPTLHVPLEGRTLATLEIANAAAGQLRAWGLPAGVEPVSESLPAGTRRLLAFSARADAAGDAAPGDGTVTSLARLGFVLAGDPTGVVEVRPAGNMSPSVVDRGWPAAVGGTVATTVDWSEFPDPALPLTLGRAYPVVISMAYRPNSQLATSEPRDVEWELVTNRLPPPSGQNPPLPFLSLGGEPRTRESDLKVNFQLVVPGDLPEGDWDVAVSAKGVSMRTVAGAGQSELPSSGATSSTATSTTSTSVLRYRIEAPIRPTITEVTPLGGDAWLVAGTLERSGGAAEEPVEIFTEGLPIELNPGRWTSSPGAAQFRVIVPAASASQGAEWGRTGQLKLKLGNFVRGFSYEELSQKVAAEAK